MSHMEITGLLCFKMLVRSRFQKETQSIFFDLNRIQNGPGSKDWHPEGQIADQKPDSGWSRFTCKIVRMIPGFDSVDSLHFENQMSIAGFNGIKESMQVSMKLNSSKYMVFQNVESENKFWISNTGFNMIQVSFPDSDWQWSRCQNNKHVSGFKTKQIRKNPGFKSNRIDNNPHLEKRGGIKIIQKSIDHWRLFQLEIRISNDPHFKYSETRV